MKTKGSRFQHLELSGVTFHLGLKQTKNTAVLRLFQMNDDPALGYTRRRHFAFLRRKQSGKEIMT